MNHAPVATDQLVEDLLSLWRVLRRRTHPVHRAEMTLEQFWLLRHLARRGPSSIGQLAAALGISQSAATTACKRLERDGLLTRERQAEDERVVLVGLTPLGTQQVEVWRKRRRAALAELLAPLEPPEQAELERLIRRVLETAEGAEVAPDH